MNKREQEQYAAFFEEIYETEELLDFIKVQLVHSSNYNPDLIFDLIAQTSSSISPPQMRAYLVDKVTCSQRELYEIFERFDWSRQGSISREDFLNELVPFGRKVDCLKRQGGSLSAQIEGHFISLIVEILKRFRIIEVARKQLKYIQPYEAFGHIDYQLTGRIGIPSLRKFFFENDFNVSDSQLYYLLHGLRRRCYREVNLEVFTQNVDPLQFGFYIGYQNQLDQERQAEFNDRSRVEQEVMRRSRVQAQRIEHEFQKAQRKKQAELERQLELQDKVNVQIIQQEENKQRQIRRALLQEDRNIRYDLASGGQLYRQELIRNQYSRIENEHLNNLLLREQEANASLTNSALKRQQDLQRSRKLLSQQRDILYREQIERERNLIRNSIAAREVEFSRRKLNDDSRRRIEEQSRRIDDQNKRFYELERSRRRAEQEAYEKMLQASRREIQESRKLREEQDKRLDELRRKTYKGSRVEHQRIYNGLEKERQRAREQISQIRSNRIAQYEKELERTRYDPYGQSRKTGGEISGYR